MEQIQQLRKKKIITLIGRLETPIILSNPFVKKRGCWMRVVGDPLTDQKPLFTYIGKLVKGEKQIPTVLRGYRGFVKISCVDYSEEKAKRKINQFLALRFIGRRTSEGYGKVVWLDCTIDNYQSQKAFRYKKFKIRKGLGVNYPKQLQRLLIAFMLHDFVHTEKHQSKIFQQVTIDDEMIREACLNHHNREKLTNQYHSIVQYYDGLASYISRQKPHNTTYRYDKLKGVIDFQLLKQDIEERQNSAYKLYHYIYHSEELTRVVESFQFGNNSLKKHLLLMVNLAINDYYEGRINIKNEVISFQPRKKKISVSATKSEEHLNAKDAEMHSFPFMSNADSEEPNQLED